MFWRFGAGALSVAAPLSPPAANLQRWYKADALSLSDNALVATWPDSSGHGADLTASGSSRPTFVAARWNGLPGVAFSLAQALSSTATAGRPTSDVTVFAVLEHGKRGSSPQFVTWATGGLDGWNLYGSSATDANAMPPAFIALTSGGTWGDSTQASSVRPGRMDPFIVMGQRTGSTIVTRVDGTQDSSSGHSGALNYGSGPITLELGNKPSSAPFEGTIYEVLIYDRALTTAEIKQAEAYLDTKWRVTLDKAKYVGMFNGSGDNGSTYNTGVCWSPNGKRFRRLHTNPVLSVVSATFESNQLKEPCILWDGTQYVCYYTGYDSGSVARIGRATSPDGSTWTKYAANPVLAPGASGSFDDQGCSFPVVVYDTTAPEYRRWRMWYGAKHSGATSVAHAWSTDGLAWTKYGVVVSPGAGGSWEATNVLPGFVCINGSTGAGTLVYGGNKQNTAPYLWQGAAATFTTPESTYTKASGNPLMTNRTTQAQALTANTGAGSRTVTVGSTAAFLAHQSVWLSDTTRSELSRVLTVDSGTQLTLEWPTDHAYNTGNSASIRSMAMNSVFSRAGEKQTDGTWVLWAVPFQAGSDLNSQLTEMTERHTTSSLTSATTPDDATGILMNIEDTGSWQQDSSENLSVIRKRI